VAVRANLLGSFGSSISIARSDDDVVAMVSCEGLCGCEADTLVGTGDEGDGGWRHCEGRDVEWLIGMELNVGLVFYRSNVPRKT
jgi:hypothetical protein